MKPEPDREAVLSTILQEAAGDETSAALIRFLWRYHDHPLSEKARHLLANGNYLPARNTAGVWVDRKVVEFDAARRDGSISALNDFIGRYPGHPLALEAARIIEAGSEGAAKPGDD